IYNRRTKKIMETMNVAFDELSAMAFEQCSSKPGLQCMTSGQISSELDLTYASSTITKQQPTKDNVPIPTNSSSHATNIPITSQDVNELNLNAMIDGNTFVNPFATSSSNAAETSSLQNNKHDEEQKVIRNKSGLVVRGYRQEEGLDFEESFAPLLEWKLSGYSWQTLHINRSPCFKWT
nr:Gag-Pol polyprotein [Tanacetum cinerariifolium]